MSTKTHGLFGQFDEDARVPASAEKRTRIENCETHGEYEAYLSPWGLDRTFVSPCPRCREEERIEEEERIRREQHAWHIERCLQNAGIPLRFQGDILDTYKAETKAQREALTTAKSYASNFPENLKLGRCLAFVGKPGTGKTHLACGVLTALAKAGHGVQYTTVAEVIRSLRRTWQRDSEQSEAAVLRDLRALHLLVLDEVGMQYGTDAERTQLSELVDLRYQHLRSTLIVSNSDMSGLVHYLGERAVDRLREHGGRIITFDWASYRSIQQTGGNR